MSLKRRFRLRQVHPTKRISSFTNKWECLEENEVLVTRAGKTDRFSNHVKNPEEFLKQLTQRKKIENEPVIWKNPDNSEEAPRLLSRHDRRGGDESERSHPCHSFAFLVFLQCSGLV